eukprot:366232-Chlamydomonas_euryale.AAC.1
MQQAHGQPAVHIQLLPPCGMPIRCHVQASTPSLYVHVNTTCELRIGHCPCLRVVIYQTHLWMVTAHVQARCATALQASPLAPSPCARTNNSGEQWKCDPAQHTLAVATSVAKFAALYHVTDPHCHHDACSTPASQSNKPESPTPSTGCRSGPCGQNRRGQDWVPEETLAVAAWHAAMTERSQ